MSENYITQDEVIELRALLDHYEREMSSFNKYSKDEESMRVLIEFERTIKCMKGLITGLENVVEDHIILCSDSIKNNDD